MSMLAADLLALINRHHEAMGVTFATAPAPVFLSGTDVPDYLRGVEIATAGMDWPASTGTVTLTMEHLADAVRAANEDPHVQVPRVRLGHTSDLNDGMPQHDPFAALGDAEPSFGRFVNLRLTNGGAVLLGDMTDVPEWLALSAPSAFPNRSMEASWNVTTEGGKSYRMVVTAVSLLGTELPAVRDLADLASFITGGPDALKETSMSTSLSVSTDRVRKAFNYEWATDDDNDFEGSTYWWWARDIRLDPNEVVADDDEGNLYVIPFSTDGDDTVTFGEPVKVRQTYVPVTAAASFTRPKKATPTAANGRPDPEENTMDDKVRDFLVAQGIDPAAATEDQTNAASVYVAAGFDIPKAPAAEVVETPADDEVVDEVRDADPIAAAQSAAFSTLTDEVKELRAREEKREQDAAAARKDKSVKDAVQAGRISPAERAHYRDLLDVDEERAGALLSALPEGRIPLAARGESPDPVSASSADDDYRAYMRDHHGLEVN